MEKWKYIKVKNKLHLHFDSLYSFVLFIQRLFFFYFIHVKYEEYKRKVVGSTLFPLLILLEQADHSSLS